MRRPWRGGAYVMCSFDAASHNKERGMWSRALCVGTVEGGATYIPGGK